MFMIKRLKDLYILLICMIFLMLGGCGSKESISSDITHFYNTPAEELAKAVQKEDIKKIDEIVSAHPELLNYQEPTLDVTLLFWAAKCRKYKSAEELLKLGADPDIVCETVHGPALLAAVEFPANDITADKSPEMVELLLKYGADPNVHLVVDDYQDADLLSWAVGRGFEKVTALVDSGADINYHQSYPDRPPSAVEEALIFGEVETAKYLILEKHADCLTPMDYIDEGNYRREYTIYFLLGWWNTWPDIKYEEERYQYVLSIAEEMLRQCEQSDDEEAKEYTMQKIRENFPELLESSEPNS